MGRGTPGWRPVSGLLRKPGAPDPDGKVLGIAPSDAGWEYTSFDLYRRRPGETALGQTGGTEAMLVFVEGRGHTLAGGKDYGEIGGRQDLFTREPPWSLYLPPGTAWRVEAASDLDLAVCRAPAEGRYPARLVPPGEVPTEIRGLDANERHVHPIMMEDRDWAERLLVVEVYTPDGHWSSYPPHKHDADEFPAETRLEEVYYHRIAPRTGFALQRVYTDSRDLDETMAIEDGDTVLVPRGYHSCGAPYGHELYYLNVMAGPIRKWRFRNDPDFEWLFQRDLARAASDKG